MGSSYGTTAFQQQMDALARQISSLIGWVLNLEVTLRMHDLVLSRARKSLTQLRAEKEIAALPIFDLEMELAVETPVEVPLVTGMKMVPIVPEAPSEMDALRKQVEMVKKERNELKEYSKSLNAGLCTR